MKTRKTVLGMAAVAAALVLQPAISAADATPDPAGEAIRKELSEPFCYLRFPTDQIGFEGSPNATIVTDDGAFLSPFGQLSFYAGDSKSLRPVSQSVKTLLEDCLPVIQFGFDRDGLHYQFEAFATPADLDVRGNLITFVECVVSNPGKQPQTGVLGANFGEIDSDVNLAPTDWFKGQRVTLKNSWGFAEGRKNPWHPKRFLDEAKFNAGKKEVLFDQGRMTQGGHLVFSAPAEGAKPGMPSYENKFKEAAVQYDVTLAPGEKHAFRFKMPAIPVALSKPEATKQVLEADHDKIRAKTITYWKAQLAKGDHFWVDDPKVMNTLRTSIVNELIPREVSEQGRIYQRDNRIQYNHFWIRSGAYFVHTYDLMGYPDIARETLDAFFVWKDGKPVSFYKPGAPQPPDARLDVQEDYWGEVLWAVGAHYRMVKEKALLEQVYPLLGPHIDQFTAMCKADPKGFWPAAGKYDNEVIDGHYTGHSFWALMGLRYAVYLAKEMGRPDDAKKWQKVHDDYETNFLKQLRALTAQSEGYIPPGMDNVMDGNDWDNACGGLFPFEVLTKDDPMVRATLETARNFNYQEGIMTYGGNAWTAKLKKRKEGVSKARGMVHLYETFDITESNTILGEQRKVIEDLYAILAHTGSTHSGWEFLHDPWARNAYGNFAPHAWFHCLYTYQIRNLLVREEGTEVHLASALAPLWVRAGKQVKVTGAPTFFGSVSYTLDCRQDGGTVALDNHWKEKGGPSAVVLHLPTWFLKDVSATVDGKPVALVGDAITLAPNVSKVELRWTRGEEPNLSYDEAVRLFLEKYHRKPVGADYDFLFPVENRGKP